MGKRWILVAVLAPPAVARAAPALDCPAGTSQRRTYYADEFWCARPDGTRHGPYRNGWAAPIEEGAYVDGKRDGLWRRWSNGVLVDERRVDRDREDGLARTWSPKGVLLSSGVMSRGSEVGLWRFWHDNGRLARRSHFAHGIEIGRRTEWKEDGSIVADGGYWNGKRDGPWVEVDEIEEQTGRGRYARDEREGRWRFTRDGQETAVGSYRRGWREGVWTIRDGDGKVQARGRYHLGRREGTWILRHVTGGADVAIAHCRKGEPHGRVLWRWEKGDDDVVAGYEIVAHYDRGSLRGRWTERYPPGKYPAHVASGLYRYGQVVLGEAFDPNVMGFVPDGSIGWPLCDEENDDPPTGGRLPPDDAGDDD
jgi:antitoxin component YwqK of YwqJK toxin-antitoxin module